ncbi:proline iminopeptidase [Neisseria gonorrhoeae]|uniref:Proline iminopeptidase n=1 Tax=Neisseria gonorrhoeae TaxID=485 RepID=A0A378VXX0_NEIGO|nr:proline iminopeptidase [Neisseria gonorrhoeae]
MAKFVAPIAENRRSRLIEAYHGLLFHQDEEVCLSAAKAWADWESYLIRFEPEGVDEDAYASLAIARLENHYFVNGGWLQGDKAILNNIGKIRHIPTVIVQGRYDLCTPMQSAWELSKAFPEAELRVVQAGHCAFDPPLADALVQAVEDILPRLL